MSHHFAINSNFVINFLYYTWIPLAALDLCPKYFHGLNDILDMKNSAKNVVLFYESRKYTIGFNEIVSSKQITLFGFQKRKCRFPQEITSKFSYPLGVYTENFCLMECRIKMAIQMCGCRPFFYQFGNHNSLYSHQYCVFSHFFLLVFHWTIPDYGPICNVSGM